MNKKAQSRFVFTSVVFYIVLIVILTSLGASFGGAEDILQFPTFPSVPDLENGIIQLAFGIIGFVLAFAGFIGLLLLFFLELVAFTFTDFVGFPLNVIIFLPLTIVLIYEIIARMIRGS